MHTPLRFHTKLLQQQKVGYTKTAVLGAFQRSFCRLPKCTLSAHSLTQLPSVNYYYASADG